MRTWFAILALCLALPAAAQEPGHQRRVALVIGVSAYQAIDDLANAETDARLIHDALAATGFTLPPPLINPTRAELEAALTDFSARAEHAAVATLYYAGHGMQQFDDNWLIPSDARLERPANIQAEGVPLQYIERYMSGATLRIIILDACRNNPFSVRWPVTRSSAIGLAAIADPPEGTVIAHSAAAGQVTPDDGAFARALAARMREEGLDLSQVFSRVSEDVARGANAPQLHLAVNTAPFYFVPARTPVADSPLSPVLAERALVHLREREFATAARYALSGIRLAPGRADQFRTALSGAFFTGAGTRMGDPHFGSAPPDDMLFSPDARRFALRRFDGVHVWDTSNGRLVATASPGREVRTAVFSADGRRLATTSFDAESGAAAAVWDAANGRLIATLDGVEGLAEIEFSPDGRRVVTRDSSRSVRVWNADNGRLLLDLSGHSESANVASFSPDGARVLTVDDRVRVWDASNGRLILTLNTERAYGASFSPDGRRIAAVHGDGSSPPRVGVWDAVNGNSIADLAPSDLISLRRAARFTPDGARLLTVTYETVRVWNVADGRLVATLNDVGGNTDAITPSPDGRYLALANGGAARVWDTSNGHLVATLWHLDVPREDILSGIQAAAFSADGQRIVTVADRSVRVWDASVLQQPQEAMERDICLRVLGASGRRFTQAEYDADAVLRSAWPNASRDVCEGVAGVPPLPN